MLPSTVPVRVRSPHCKPDKAERAARRRARPVTTKPRIEWFTPIRHPGYAEDDCPWWDMADHAKAPDVDYIEVCPLGDTEWCAFPPVTGDGGAHGRMERVAQGGNGPLHVMLPVQPVVPAPISTAPLVAAAQRKVDPMVVKIPRAADCPEVHGKAPLAYVTNPGDYVEAQNIYRARLLGAPGAQALWNAVSIGATRGLSVEESLRTFLRPAVTA